MEAEPAATTESTFATPDRENNNPTQAPNMSEKNETEAEPNTVTPLDGGESDKQVRFDEAQKEDKRGLVSRRGGRMGSPAVPPRPPAATVTTKEGGPVLEFKTFRSPQRKRDSAVENDTIPSLCSTNSGPLDRKLHQSKDDNAKPPNGSTAKQASQEGGRPSSISCDPSLSATTSPLASQDVDASPSGQARKTAAANTAAATPTKPSADDAGTRNVTFSPPTPHSEVRPEPPKKTPTKSPPPGQFQSLPSLRSDAKLTPSGIFLSPTPPSPSTYAGVSGVPTLDTKGEKKKVDLKPSPVNKDAGSIKQLEVNTNVQEEKSTTAAAAARARDQERERAVATPTDFALDFGKGLRPTGSFDASNVLAWLQSPTANGLFSPGGGFGSTLNTPRAAAPRTPRTPTNTTSFFFSDVASLPKNSDFGSPRGDNAGGKRGGPQGVYSSMICISPLAPKNRKGNGQPDTPMNYNDVFASPRNDGGDRPSNLPFLGETPSKRRPGAKKDGSVDAHMAERDLMEDEDLSVLLQLASHNTPGRSREGGHVFRSPQARAAAGYHPGAEPVGSNLPGLQLPVIGGHGDGGAKLSRKPGSREQGGSSDDFKPPQLAIRSSSSGGSKEIYLGGARPGTNNDMGTKPAANPAGKKSSGPPQKSGTAPKKNSRKTPTYSMPPYPHPGDQPPVSYYPMPGSMPGMPPSGSMRVVVGGPPPMPPAARPKGKASPSRRTAGSPSRPPPYPMPPAPGPGDARYPGMPYPPHPSHGGGYPPPPHMSGMGMPPPYPGHYPPPPHHPGHLPMYPHHPLPSVKKGKGTKAKAGSKRPSTHPGKSPAKKARKSPAKKKKSKAPASNNPAERQKAAAHIQAVNAASGGKNDKAAALAAAILRGVTMRPSGKWQAQLYYNGKSRYIGVFDTREKAALAYEIAREKLKEQKVPNDNSAQGLKATEAAVNAARKAAFEGVNEKDPRMK